MLGIIHKQRHGLRRKGYQRFCDCDSTEALVLKIGRRCQNVQNCVTSFMDDIWVKRFWWKNILDLTCKAPIGLCESLTVWRPSLPSKVFGLSFVMLFFVKSNSTKIFKSRKAFSSTNLKIWKVTSFYDILATYLNRHNILFLSILNFHSELQNFGKN